MPCQAMPCPDISSSFLSLKQITADTVRMGEHIVSTQQHQQQQQQQQQQQIAPTTITI